MAKLDPKKLLESAQKHYPNQRWKKALDDYVSLSQDPISSRDPKIHHKIGDLYVKLSDKQKATASYQEAVKCYMAKGFLLQAISVCKLAQTLDPKNQELEKRLTDLYARRGVAAAGSTTGLTPPVGITPVPLRASVSIKSSLTAKKPNSARSGTEPAQKKASTAEAAQQMFEDTM